MSPRSIRIYLYLLLPGLGLILAQGIFYLVQVSHAHHALSGVQALLKKQSFLVNPYLMGNALSDLEDLNLIRCAVVRNGSPQAVVFFDSRFKPGCHEFNEYHEFNIPLHALMLNGYPVTTALDTGNGEKWEVSFISINGRVFKISLWLVRILFTGIAALSLFWHFRDVRKRAEIHELESRHSMSLNELAAQVAHDIRSPVASLSAMLSKTQGLDEQSRVIINGAISRIRDIANNLLSRHREAKSGIIGSGYRLKPDSPTNINSSSRLSPLSPLSPLSNETKSSEQIVAFVESIISQKRIQLADNREITLKHDPALAYGLFARIQPTELSRLLSNLINNSVEAIPNSGTVNITIEKQSTAIRIRITDTGKGIPSELLSRLGQRGETHSKTGGSGFGLYHARRCAEYWGGTFAISSKASEGTTVQIELPEAQPPHWFIPRLEIKPGSTIVILDDEPMIHAIWERRFATMKPQLSVVHFSSVGEILAWYRQTLGRDGHVIYLIDYELPPSQQTGLDVIDMLGATRESVLVTHRADETAIRERCEKLDLKLLSKSLAEAIPINV
mgnify:CR=1 FL=1